MDEELHDLGEESITPEKAFEERGLSLDKLRNEFLEEQKEYEDLKQNSLQKFLENAGKILDEKNREINDLKERLEAKENLVNDFKQKLSDLMGKL